jgi:glutathione synthase/RimK-type ligase-like ATP-grasp enzyme
VLEALVARGADLVHIDDADLGALRYDVSFTPDPSGWIEADGRRIDVQQIRGVYLRPADVPVNGGRAASADLLAIVSALPGLVVNPPAAGRANASKPYQLGLIADAHFVVPDTLVTSDPWAARAFLAEHGHVIYKSISGVRSIVASLEADDVARLEQVGTGPVQLQEYVPGLDVRVHVVDERWFACSIRSDVDDYRYPREGDARAELSPFELPEPLGLQLVKLVHSMGLLVAGVDLRCTPNRTWVCFEVNPSPGFTWYEEETGHPIADAIAELLDSR